MMLGAEILTWGTQGENNPYYYPLYHYLWGGSIGHAAIKLTLPDEPETMALIQQYCCDQEGNSVIPHYRHGNCMIVYFSWWPDALMEEYQDRLEANSGAIVEYEKKWQAIFTQTREEQSGLLRYKFGALYDWFFGKPKQIPAPIKEIVHPHPQAKTVLQTLIELEDTLEEQTQTLLPLVELIESLEQQLAILQMVNHLAADDKRTVQVCQQSQVALAELERELAPHIEECKQTSAQLKNLRRYYYQEIASIGLSPQVVHLPLSKAFSAETMLQKMREIVDGPYRFDKIFYNCSTVIREIIDAGLAKVLKNKERSPHWFDTPLKIHRFACQIQEQLINLSLRQFVPQFDAGRTQVEKKTESDPLPTARFSIRPS